MKKRSLFLLALGLFAATASAQLLPPEPPAPTLMADDKGAPLKMDFRIPLVGISDPGMLFAHFSQRPLIIYYFGPKCPHCQRNYPALQKLVKEYESRGISGIAVSVGGVTKNEIRGFMDAQSASLPFLQDASRQFSDNYGTGYVPVLYLVNENGTLIRFSDGGETGMKQLRAELDKKLKKK